MKRKIKLNVYGNWNGYEGSRKVAEFGTDERDANDWLSDPVKFDREREETRAALGIDKQGKITLKPRSSVC